jgi:glycerol-3-phosphate dehydrogenase
VADVRHGDVEFVTHNAPTGLLWMSGLPYGAHGTEWHGVWSLTEADPALGGEVEPGLPYRYAELLHAITHEQAATLGDLLIRRTPVAFETRDHGRGAARRLAPTVARWLRWSREEMEGALAAYEAEVTRLFRITPD